MRKRVRDIEFDVDAYTARLIGRENVSIFWIVATD